MKHIAISENHLYSKTYQKGEKFVSRNVIVYVMKDFKAKRLMNSNPEKLYVNRIGLTVSKKIGGAVIRNRVKRVFREGLRQTEKANNVKKGFLIILVARTNAVNAKSGEIAKEIENAFFALNMIEHEENS